MDYSGGYSSVQQFIIPGGMLPMALNFQAKLTTLGISLRQLVDMYAISCSCAVTDMLTLADGINAVFWLFLNRGRHFSSVPKTLLTILNLLIIGIAGCMVRLLPYAHCHS